MALFSISGVRLAGIASAVPRQEYDNRDYDWISEKERELFIKTVGVGKRRMAPRGLTTSDLCESAAIKLIRELGWDFQDIGLLVFISQSRDHIIPATAGILQDRLGMSKQTIAYDVSLGCSGFVYGLSIVGSQMMAGQVRKALLMVGDVSTHTTSYKDKSTFPLFGDAGSVAALEYLPDAPAMHFNLQTDGSGYKAIIIPDGGIRNLASPETSFKEEIIADGIIRTRYDIALDGMAVFQFSLREVTPNVKELLQYSGKNLEEIDYFIFHQANRLMNESIRKKIGIPAEKYPYSMDIYGNTSSASLPVTINHAIREAISAKKLNLLLSGFGVGLSWGSVILETRDVVCPEILEIG
jgi:3-oxoacyl-[acyl-carrier-protein] synthase-3